MSTDEITITDTVINDLLHATMPDGSPISTAVKIDAILAAAGIDTAPLAFRRILARGINQRRNKARTSQEVAHV
ncbi:hypothetical protein Mpop_2384 [Methylorubrum populi BJ001]|jgi:predicted nucleotide-binding protein (sugar kinase/HSP70/actin superfamily)|uniref:Uncharacterized protein n=1 Tax=Methylorubrum populi (strain ATCC BAA-705 / NCIMB 13946 / BJ001) TaxID=441620 RepID=B1Z9E0_METPB|nr:hypothetical protein [Methylorubrum populi]ACB80546.1 hypothetical protein Mpop_2384 [Methylorubrum populi BJ001]